MNAHISAGLFDDIVTRIQRAVEELREAVRDGTAANPEAAIELADRMQRYADGVTGADAPALRSLKF